MVGMSNGYIAIDLGAESGRVIVGVLDRRPAAIGGGPSLRARAGVVADRVALGHHRHLARDCRGVAEGGRVGERPTTSSWCRSASIPGASIGRLSTRRASWSACRMRIAIRAIRPRTSRSSPSSAPIASIRRPASSSWRSTRCIRSTRTSWPTRMRSRRPIGCCSCPICSTIGSAAAHGRSHDRLDEPDGRLPHGRLGARHARRAGSADAYARPIRRRARRSARSARSWRRTPVCRPNLSVIAAGVARHGERDRGGARGRANELVLSVERHVVAAGRGIADAVCLRPRRRRRRSPTSWASAARRDF